MKAQKWILVKHFDGFPKDSDLQLVEEEIEDPKDGEVMVEAVFLSVDPYMRPYSVHYPLGATMPGQQVARIIRSQNPDYKVGDHVVAGCGWRTRSVINASKTAAPGLPTITKFPNLGDLPLSLGIGNLGMTGATAYFGFLRLCEPKAGETVLVNAASGAVGSVVGQIAKLKGCKVIGYAGTDEKCQWIKDLGFDYAFNYKTQDLGATLKQAAPEGIDCYFDNVGGAFTTTVIKDHMKTFGRISVCGSISGYNDKAGEQATAPYPWALFIGKQLRMEGFMVDRWKSEWGTFLKEMSQWTSEGKIKYKEHVTEGFANMPAGFFGILRGENTGKAVIKITPKCLK